MLHCPYRKMAKLCISMLLGHILTGVIALLNSSKAAQPHEVVFSNLFVMVSCLAPFPFSLCSWTPPMPPSSYLWAGHGTPSRIQLWVSWWAGVDGPESAAWCPGRFLNLTAAQCFRRRSGCEQDIKWWKGNAGNECEMCWQKNSSWVPSSNHRCRVEVTAEEECGLNYENIVRMKHHSFVNPSDTY